MLIDARVARIFFYGRGGFLALEDRPASRLGDSGGIAGQEALFFDAAPHGIAALHGRDKVIARRIGYGKIEFVPDVQFEEAMKR